NLRKLVELYGTKNWKRIANMLGTRIGKQCRERWHNHLRHGIKKSAWTEEEDRILVEAHKVFGNKWGKIALKLCGRTENAIKNRWNDCTKDDDHENAFDGEMDLSLDVTTQTTEPLASMSTTSCYVPEPATTFSWDDYFTYICESMDDIQMLMQCKDWTN
ncbi:hypothetical protein DY000_02033734, partial [Brassica cretica]